MWEKPNRMEAVHQPANALLLARDSRFCSNPRKRNSSGHAVKKRMLRAVNGSDFHSPHCGSSWMKCMRMPSGMAMHASTRKLPTMRKPQLRLQAME